MTDFYRSDGFVIAKNDIREADQLFRFYSRDFGKVEILGRAIRKIKSKLRAGIDLFYFSELEFIQGKAYKTLTDSLAIEKFKNIRQDLKKLEIAYRICETVDVLISGQEKDEKIFNLLEKIFTELNNCKLENDNQKLEIFYYYFFWNFTSLLGYQIDLHNCSLCQEKLSPESLFFEPEDGGMVCDNCRKVGLKIYPEAVKIARFLTKNCWDRISKLKFEEQYMKYFKDLSSRHFDYIKMMTHCV